MSDDIKDAVKSRYAAAARQASAKTKASCCSSSCCSSSGAVSEKDPISRNLYNLEELSGLPLEAALASLGCGNPMLLAQLEPGESVLDLGSGGGIDVLLSAKRVGPQGFVYGLDMTDEMLELARKNAAAAGVTNVKFLKGEIESIPLPDCSVDVIISNCVINLSADKDRVLAEAYRCLKPGGRFAVSDMAVDGELPEAVRGDVMAWSGCIAGALEVGDYRARLRKAGFSDIDITPFRVHRTADMIEFGLESVARMSAQQQQELDGKLWSAFIRARKP